MPALRSLTCCLLTMLAISTAPAQTRCPERPPDETVRIWDSGWNGKLPGGWSTDKPESSEVTPHMGGTLAVKDISVPQLACFTPAANASDRAVIIFPGGGYNILAWDLEGTEVATWLSSLGYHAFVLKYRLPRAGDAVRHAAALEDAQRAVSLVRSQAKARGLDPDKIGVMGFSAGGHLAALASCAWTSRVYPAGDDIDAVSCRPSFAVMVHPAYLVKDDTSPLDPTLTIPDQVSPAFLVTAQDDTVPPRCSTEWLLALRQRKVPCELHIYPDGGHGYGMRSDKSVKDWPARLAAWLARQDGK